MAILENEPSETIEHSDKAKQKIKIKDYKNEKNLMLYPFCSTSKRKRINPIHYISQSGERWLDVTANNTYGMAKIWDFDILRFVFSKLAAIAHSTEWEHYPQKISFTAYECLQALQRDPKSGKNIQWLREALDRLASTTYKGNIFREEQKRVTGFTLIKYEYVETNEQLEHISVTLDERLIESISASENLLKINNLLIKEEAGIKKRLLELVDASIQHSKSWSIPLIHLQQLCANDWSLSRFKFELSTYEDLPWTISFTKEPDFILVTFTRKQKNQP